MNISDVGYFNIWNTTFTSLTSPVTQETTKSLQIYQSEGIIHSTTFRNLQYTNGYAILVTESQALFESVSFFDSESQSGVLYIESRSNVTFRTCTFFGNTATNGAAMTIEFSTVSIYSSQFATHSSKNQGGALVATSSSLTVYDTIFERYSLMFIEDIYNV